MLNNPPVAARICEELASRMMETKRRLEEYGSGLLHIPRIAADYRVQASHRLNNFLTPGVSRVRL
ncbi:MAG: hypothetical protein HY314_04565 [Acidobacteria bacterium]|nr:hypothetical protein [Acidobacteriota bacterium]